MLFSTKVAATVAALATLALAKDKPTPGCNANTNPTQVRIAYAGPGGMAVSWNTNQQLSKPSVSYGTDKANLDKVASSDVSTKYQSSSTWNNHVIISGLEADTKYHYLPQCGNVTYKFKTAREAGKDKAFTFAMVGDMGTFGPDGLSTTVGKGAANALPLGANTTIQSLQALKSKYKFIWHGRFHRCWGLQLTCYSRRHCIRRFLGQGGAGWLCQPAQPDRWRQGVRSNSQ
jgi:hypothetical protein